MIHEGDCIAVMQGMEAESVDSIVTDPPYGLEFMGKEWDRFAVGRAAKYKRGGALKSAEGIEERRGKGGAGPSYVQRPALRCDTCGKQKWSGSPCKCENPEWREDNSPLHAFQAWCEAWGRAALRVVKPGAYLLAFGGTRTHHRLVCGLEDAGWIIRDELDWIYASGFPKGKANLKPAHEPIVLARKPGPLQPLAIDECRIGTDGWSRQDREAGAGFSTGKFMGSMGNGEPTMKNGLRESTAGRWPSNVLLSEPALFDEPNPEVVGSGKEAFTAWTAPSRGIGQEHDRTHGKGLGEPAGKSPAIYGDSGGYSRFFIVPKADRADREPVLRGQTNGNKVWSDGREKAADYPSQRGKTERENAHPTVKPTDLMRHLVRLVTPQGGTVLDCFLGSGSTALAAELEGFQWVGIEKEAEYVKIAEARLNGTQKGLGLDVPAPTRTHPIGRQGPDIEGRNSITRGGWGRIECREHEWVHPLASGVEQLPYCRQCKKPMPPEEVV